MMQIRPIFYVLCDDKCYDLVKFMVILLFFHIYIYHINRKY